MLYSRNWHNIANQLYVNKKKLNYSFEIRQIWVPITVLSFIRYVSFCELINPPKHPHIKQKMGIKKKLTSEVTFGQNKSRANGWSNKNLLNSELEEGGDRVLGWDGEASKLRHKNQVIQA